MVVLSDEIVSLLKEYMDAVTDSDGDYVRRSADQLVGALEIAFAMSKSTITMPTQPYQINPCLNPKDLQITCDPKNLTTQLNGTNVTNGI